MLTVMMTLFIRRMMNRPNAVHSFIRSRRMKFAAVVFILLLTGLSADAQIKKYSYNITISGKPAGELNLVQRIISDSQVIDINMAIFTRFLFMFRVTAIERTIFQNGRLRYTHISRQINKGKKTITVTRDMGSVYHSQKEGKELQLKPAPILYNMSSLYLVEPIKIRKVYSDVFQEFLEIITLAPHHYKIRLPDGNYNEYFYKNGICKTIKVHNTLFSARLELRT